MPDPLLRQLPSTTELAGSRRYRFWPVYAAAFTRTLSYTIYGVALPNYINWFLGVPEWLYGVIISVYALAYITGPLVAMPITKHIGARNGTFLSVAGSIILVGLQLVFIDPAMLIVLRGIDGFLLGFFWPNLQKEISSWQRAVPEKGDGQFFQTYGMSWNIGILIGNMGGALIVFLGAGNEYLALFISWLAMISMLPCVLAMEKPGTTIAMRDAELIATTAPATAIPTPEIRKEANQNPSILAKQTPAATRYLLSFPALFYLIGTLLYAYIKGFYPFVYPIALFDAGIDSYVVYFVTFIHQALQTIIIATWARKGVRLNHGTWIAAMLINLVFFAWLWVAMEPIQLTAAFVVSGILSGWLYTFTSKIMLEYGAVENSLKYATYYEFFNGIGFGLAPLLAGVAATIDPTLNYAIMTLLVATSCAVLFAMSAKAAARRKGRP